MAKNSSQKGLKVKTSVKTRETATKRSGKSRRSSTVDQVTKISDLTESNRKLKRKIFDLYTIFEISRNFNAVHDYLSLLDSFIYTCLGQVGSLKGAIFLKTDGRGGAFYFTKAKGSGKHPTTDQNFLIKSPLLNYLTRLNRPVLVEELLGEISTDAEKEIITLFEDGIVVPLIYQTRLSGIFIMAEKISGDVYQTVDSEFLSVLGNQIAVAIENARLYESERMAIRELRAAQQKLLQTERLAALGEMSAKVAHEVNNPLGIIKNYLLLIGQSDQSVSESQDYVRIVDQEIDRIAHIVRQLLEFHRPHDVELRPLDIEKTIEEVLLFMERPLASDNVTLIRRLSGKSPFVLGEADSLKQVFLNLLINARDAVPDGGTLTIESAIDNDNVVVRFIDSGPGIPHELVPRIFEPFFSTKEAGEGTGLGLSVCYGIIKHHEGSISFTNMEIGGCFKIRIPLSPGKPDHDSQ